MIIEIPDINLDTASLEELKEHAKHCARAENEVRAHAIATQFQIIKILPVGVLAYEHTPTGTTITKRPQARAKAKQKSVKDRYYIEEDEFSLDDFRSKG